MHLILNALRITIGIVTIPEGPIEQSRYSPYLSPSSLLSLLPPTSVSLKHMDPLIVDCEVGNCRFEFSSARAYLSYIIRIIPSLSFDVNQIRQLSFIFNIKLKIKIKPVLVLSGFSCADPTFSLYNIPLLFWLLTK